VRSTSTSPARTSLIQLALSYFLKWIFSEGQ
jgi:hypothetical protein